MQAYYSMPSRTEAWMMTPFNDSKSKLLPTRPNSFFTYNKLPKDCFYSNATNRRFYWAKRGWLMESSGQRSRVPWQPRWGRFQRSGTLAAPLPAHITETKERAVKDCWQRLVRHYKEDSSCLPLPRLKLYNSQGKAIYQGDYFKYKNFPPFHFVNASDSSFTYIIRNDSPRQAHFRIKDANPRSCWYGSLVTI